MAAAAGAGAADPVPSVAVCKEILVGVYSSILRRANVPIGAALDAQGTQSGYEAVTHELDRIRVEIAKSDDTLAVALTNYFGYRDFTNRAGVGAMFTHDYPSVESDQVYDFMRRVDPGNRNLCIVLNRTAVHHVLSVVTAVDRASSVYHMTIPRNPIGLNDRDPPKNFTIHYTDDRIGSHLFHRFNFPEGAQLGDQVDETVTAAVELEVAAVDARTAAALAAAPADPASVAKAARAARPPPPAAEPPPPPPGHGRPSWRDRNYAPPSSGPPPGPQPRYGRGRKTKRNRRTRRR